MKIFKQIDDSILTYSSENSVTKENYDISYLDYEYIIKQRFFKVMKYKANSKEYNTYVYIFKICYTPDGYVTKNVYVDFEVARELISKNVDDILKEESLKVAEKVDTYIQEIFSQKDKNNG